MSDEVKLDNMNGHVVRLPYPNRDNPVFGRCDAGDWEMSYGWGERGMAEAGGMDHIAEVAKMDSEPVFTLAGDTTIYPTTSL